MLGSQFAHAVLSTSIEHNIFIPPKLCKGQFNFFCVGKSDFSGDTPEGKNTLYATAMGVFQQKPAKDHETCLFKIKTGESNFKVGAPGNLAKTLYESKKLLKFIETVNILLTQINIQEKG